MIVIVMGVTGCGKTTLGQALAERLGLPFYDADDFHPATNRAKLQADIPLDDSDRWPWLRTLAGNLEQWERDGGAVLACSALKESYREVLLTGSSNLRFVFIHGEKSSIAARLMQRARSGHLLIIDYDKILDGQYRDLEPPLYAVNISAELPVAEALETALAGLGKVPSSALHD